MTKREYIERWLVDEFELSANIFAPIHNVGVITLFCDHHSECQKCEFGNDCPKLLLGEWMEEDIDG